MPNGTYGGVRGRKTKVGEKTTFVFLLLDFTGGYDPLKPLPLPALTYLLRKYTASAGRLMTAC